MTIGFDSLVTRIGRCCVALMVLATPLQAHPHVFVDGGVDFVFGSDGRLESLQVTWLYDPFETLYILSSSEISLNAAGGLEPADRQRLIELRSNWPSDFEGASHLSSAEAPVGLARPHGFDVVLINGRLQVTFERNLERPIDLRESAVDVDVYEATYFYAFTVTNIPQLLGQSADCSAEVIPYARDPQNSALERALAALGREETPEDARVGAYFADRISVTCA